MTDDSPAIRRRTPAEKLRRCAELLLKPKIDNELRAGVAITLRQVADELEQVAAPEFPLPIRPDGTHYYLSTGCVHGDAVTINGVSGHEYCKGMTGLQGAKRPGSCKGCGAICACPVCKHDVPTPVGTAAATTNESAASVGTSDSCQIVEVDGGPVRLHGGDDMDATSAAYLGEVVAAAKRLVAMEPPGPLDFDCPQCGAVPGQLCRRESGMGGRAPHQERRALAPLRSPTTPEVEPLPSTATGAPAYVAGPATGEAL